jgi:transposase
MMFYNWKARFEEEGYPGLEKCKSRAPKKTPQKEKRIEEQVIAMYRAHPDWGKKRIEQELAKWNNWVPLVSSNTVRRILRDANLWSASRTEKKGRGRKAEPEGR